MHKISEQTLALAGLLQSVSLVNQLAKRGSCDISCSNASLTSITNLNGDITAVFKTQTQLSVGIDALKMALGKRPKSVHIITYALSLISLEKKLMKNPALLNTLSSEISALNQQKFFEITHTNSIARLAQLYKATLGTLNPIIMIKGEQLHLSNPRTANHIRALLLAGIRSVSLWRSQGGKNWHLMVNKRKMLAALEVLEKSV
jgi:high frequency lysogenization protein